MIPCPFDYGSYKLILESSSDGCIMVRIESLGGSKLIIGRNLQVPVQTRGGYDIMRACEILPQVKAIIYRC